MSTLLKRNDIRRKIKKLAESQKLKELDRKLSVKTKALVKKDKKIKAYIHDYTDGSYDLNSALYEKRKLYPCQKETADNLDALINKFKISKGFVVYSGIKWHPGIFATKKAIRNPEVHPIRVVLRGFTSTSLSETIAENFAHMNMGQELEVSDWFKEHGSGIFMPHYHPQKEKKLTHYDLTREEFVEFNQIDFDKNNWWTKKYSEEIEKRGEPWARFDVARKKCAERINKEFGVNICYNEYYFIGGRDIGSILQIHVPRGYNALYVRPVSTFKNEYEVILPRKTKLEIIGLPVLNIEKRKYVWDARVVA